MLRGTRPTVPLVASLVVVTGLLAACGDSTPGTGLPFASRLDAVTISGDIGAAKIEFKERMDADDLETTTPVTGEGDALAAEDKVFVNYAIGNGYTEDTTLDSFGAEDLPVQVTVGAAATEPADLDGIILNMLGEQIKAGITKESRIVVTGSSEALFGAYAGAPDLAEAGIGNDDGLVLVADVMDVSVLDGPEDSGQVKSPGWAPKLTFNGNGLTGFDFAGIDKPGDKASQLFTVLKTGTGPAVAAGDLLVADYMFAAYGKKKPALETYSTEPTNLPVGEFTAAFPSTGVNEILEGKTVGSRIIMRIPPAKAFGEQAQGGQVPANSTIYFVIDILAAV